MDNNSQAAITQLGCFVYTKAYIGSYHYQNWLVEKDIGIRNIEALQSYYNRINLTNDSDRHKGSAENGGSESHANN